jgi:hypothetical protein
VPMIAEKQKEGVLIQIQEKRRGRDGRMTFRKSKSLTVYNVTIDEAYQRIAESFTKPTIF